MWVSINSPDERPENEVTYLCYCYYNNATHPQYNMYYQKVMTCIENGFDTSPAEEVLFWQPIPAAPEGYPIVVEIPVEEEIVFEPDDSIEFDDEPVDDDMPVSDDVEAEI